MDLNRRRLTLATIIFLPLTLLTGYFVRLLLTLTLEMHTDRTFQGMNFDPMWSVNFHSDALYVPLLWSRTALALRVSLHPQVLADRGPGDGRHRARFHVARHQAYRALHRKTICGAEAAEGSSCSCL
jgi:hypothetical protein